MTTAGMCWKNGLSLIRPCSVCTWPMSQMAPCILHYFWLGPTGMPKLSALHRNQLGRKPGPLKRLHFPSRQINGCTDRGIIFSFLTLLSHCYLVLMQNLHALSQAFCLHWKQPLGILPPNHKGGFKPREIFRNKILEMDCRRGYIMTPQREIKYICKCWWPI